MMKRKWLTAVIIYSVLVIACLGVVYAVPYLRGVLEKTYVAEYGKIDLKDEVSAFIVRDETVYAAAFDCRIKRVAETGELLKAGTRIVEMTEKTEEMDSSAGVGSDVDQAAAEAAAVLGDGGPDNISRKYEDIMADLGDSAVRIENGKSRDAGYISYSVDGTEAKYSTENLFNLKQKDYETLSKFKSEDTPKRDAGKGEPLFKVIHNSRWYLVYYIDNKAGEKYTTGRTVTVNIADEDTPATIADVQVGKKTTKVTLACKKFFDGFAEMRTLDTTVIVASAEGLVLQDSSIVMKGEQKGVLVKNKLGEHVFKPVSIKTDDGERCVAFSDIYVDENGNFVETIKTYDEIVAEPTDEEKAALQEQAKREAIEAEEAAKKKAEEERIEAERAAAAKAAAEKEAAEKAAAEKAAAEQAAAEQAGQPAGQQPAPEQTPPDEQAVIDAQQAAGIQSDPAPEPLTETTEGQ